MQVTMNVNGEDVTRDVEPRLLLIHFLRDHLRPHRQPLGLRHVSNCGVCVVWMDGATGEDRAPCSRRWPTAAACARSKDLEQGGGLDPIQQGFMNEHGLQCGFCTPAMMMTGRALLDRNPDPSDDEIREAICGTICRCTGYENIVRAIRWAAEHQTTEEGDRHDRHRSSDQRRRQPDRVRPDAAQGRRPVPARAGQLRRRHRPARHAARCDPAQPGTPTPIIKSIDTSAAEAHPKVKAVITGAILETLGLAWMPTLSYDTAGRAGHRQGALPGPGGRLRRRRGQVLGARRAGVDRRRVRDRSPPVIDAKKALDPGAPVIRTDKEGKTDNHIFDWEAGDAAKCDAAFAKADVDRRRRTCSTRAPIRRRWRRAASVA